MGAHVREDHEKFHAIAATLPELYKAVEAVMNAQNNGPIEIDIQVRAPGGITRGFSADVANPAELLEMLRLTLGK
jgi:hypothetical protein